MKKNNSNNSYTSPSGTYVELEISYDTPLRNCEVVTRISVLSSDGSRIAYRNGVLFWGELEDFLYSYLRFLREVSSVDSEAADWIKEIIREVVISDSGTRISEFFLDSGDIDIQKVRDYDKTISQTLETGCKGSVKFKNKRGTEIKVEYYSNHRDTAWITAESRVERGSRSWESMPVLVGTYLCSFDDYHVILREVLRKDKVARRWFRKTVKDIVDFKGTKLGDFFLESGKLDVQKVRDYDSEIWNEWKRGRSGRLPENNNKKE